jgi:hypothetical protein
MLIAIKDTLDDPDLLDRSLEEKEAIIRKKKMRHARSMPTDL